ncbi:MAG: hypothetical protein V4510_03365 [bacterium]
MHRVGLCLVLVLATLVPCVSVQGQSAGSTPAPTPLDILTDPAKDVHVQGQGADQAIPDARYKALDLVGATIQETADQFIVKVQVASLADHDIIIAEDGAYTVHFVYQEIQFGVVMNRYVSNQDYLYGQLLRYDEGAKQPSYVGYVDVTEDTTAGVVTGIFERTAITDRNGASPFPGRFLDGFWADSHLPYANGPFIGLGITSVSFPADVTDRMPDTGNGLKPLAIQLGLKQQGHALLTSDDPMRASNGEATTFVFTAKAKNLGTEEDLFEMVPTAAPSNWAVTIPDQFLRLKGGEEKTIPILVSVPFYHVHGDAKRFVLEMQSKTDPATVGRVGLGVRYYAIPQPAGHHPQLWVHSQGYGKADDPVYMGLSKVFTGNVGYNFMNAQMDDTSDQKLEVTGQNWGYYCDQSCSNTDLPRSLWKWYVFLSPGLEMGLDFDLAKEGQLSIPIKTTLNLPKAQLDANLWHYAYDEKTGRSNQTLVGRFAPADPIDLGAGDSHTFDFKWKAGKGADYLAYHKYAGLVLEVNFTSISPALFLAPGAPMMEPGATIVMPLIEYHDPIADAFAAASAVKLQPTTDLNRVVNSGKTVVYQATLLNGEAHSAKFQVAMEGVNKQWAEILTPGPISVDGSMSAPVRFALHVPATATPLDATDFVLTVQDTMDPSQRALLHFTARIDNTQNVPDEQPNIDSLRSEPAAKSSPAPVGIALAVALLGAALLRRRKD